MSALNQNDQIQFPVSYVLKVFFEVAAAGDRHLSDLDAVLTEMGISHQASSSTASGKGKYVSVATPVTVKDRETYEKLYKRLQGLDGVKCAI